MACFNEKFTAGVAGSAFGGAGVGLVASTATGPAFFAAAVGWLVVCAKFGESLGKLALCLEANGQFEAAAIIRAKVDAILQEIEDFRTWGRSVGAPL